MRYIILHQLLGEEILYWNHLTLLLIPAAAITVIASDNNDSRPNFQTLYISRYLWRFDTSVSKGELESRDAILYHDFLFIFFRFWTKTVSTNLLQHEIIQMCMSLDLFHNCFLFYPSRSTLKCRILDIEWKAKK